MTKANTQETIEQSTQEAIEQGTQKAIKQGTQKAIKQGTQETIKQIEIRFLKDFEENERKKAEEAEKEFKKKEIPTLRIGDNIKVGVKIIEGERERVQFYEGTIIARKNSSINTTITVRKTLQGIGIERIFLIYSPKIDSISVLRSSKVRRSKLYYLRNLKGKASRLKQTFK